MAVDLVLSSGFLAFAEHAGFLAAVEELGLEVRGVCGTSSGALCGSLWLAGMPASEVLARTTAEAPLAIARPSWTPWRGLLRLQPVIERLAEDLPARFADLDRPLAAGVIDSGGRPTLLTRGPLPEAVAASCAIPWLFPPVLLGGERYADGGVADRTGLARWRALRPDQPTLLHLLDRTGGAEDAPIPTGVTVLRSPRSGARLWNLGDVSARFSSTRDRALRQLGDQLGA